MKPFRQTFLLAILMSMVGVSSSAHDLEVKNVDDVPIYYNYIKNGTELEVTYRGSSYKAFNHEYSKVVYIPAEVNYMGKTYKVTRIGDEAFKYCYTVTEITLPNSITSIGNYAFSHFTSNYKGRTIVIPEKVTSIGDYAFENCFLLKYIKIPKSVTSIGKDAFSGCSGLTEVRIDDIAAWCRIKFYDCHSNPLILKDVSLYLTNVGTINDLVIPEDVLRIGESAFSGSDLTSVTIPRNLSSIGEDAFWLCFDLEKVIVPDIAAWCRITFYNSDSNPLKYAKHLYKDSKTEIKDLVIPEGVTNIGSYAFENCNSLTSVTIPNGVLYLGYNAFNFTNSAENLVSIVSQIENPKDVNESAFSAGLYANAVLYVPVGTTEKYKACKGWQKFVRIEEGLPSGINDVVNTQATVSKHYNLSGKQLAQPQQGFNIVRMNDGSIRKVVIK